MKNDWLNTFKLALEGLKVLGQNIETLKTFAQNFETLMRNLEEVKSLLQTNRELLKTVTSTVAGDAEAIAGLKNQLNAVLSRLPGSISWPR